MSFIFEARAIIEDCRINSIGGLSAGVDIWELAYLPTLLNNCQTWVEIGETTIQKLDDLQHTMYRTLLSVPQSTPWPALVWDCGGIKMKFRIMLKKLVFVSYILNQNDESLALQMLKIQEKLKLPGLVKECKTIITDLRLPDIFTQKITHNSWSNIVKGVIFEENEKELKNDMEKFKKTKNSDLVGETFGMRGYLKELNVSESRTFFKHRTRMTRYAKTNFKNDPHYAKSLWKCDNCPNIDSEQHILWCKEYEDLRLDKDLSNNKELCQYLKEALKLRAKQELERFALNKNKSKDN